MKPIQILTKHGCEDCKVLKQFLNSEKIPFEELSLEQKTVQNKLLDDPKFKFKFCEIESCLPHTPAIRNPETGEYFFKGLDGIWNLYELQKLIKEQFRKK